MLRSKGAIETHRLEDCEMFDDFWRRVEKLAVQWRDGVRFLLIEDYNPDWVAPRPLKLEEMTHYPPGMNIILDTVTQGHDRMTRDRDPTQEVRKPYEPRQPKG